MTEKKAVEPSLRPATVDDVPALVQLWFDTWHATSPHLHHPDPIGQWEHRFREEIMPTETVLLAEVDGALAGFMGLREAEGYLHLLYVSPPLQGQGVGSLLLAEAIRRCPGRLMLKTLESNSSARSFYERRGWIAGESAPHPRTGHPSVVYQLSRDVN